MYPINTNSKMSCEYAFTVTVGDSLELGLTVTDPSTSTAYNLTGCTVYFDAKAQGSTSYAFQKQYTSFTDPTNGKTVLGVGTTITDSLSPNTYYDFGVKVKNPSVIVDGQAQEFTIDFEINTFKTLPRRTQE